MELANQELTDGPRREFLVPENLLENLELKKGNMVELVTEQGAPLRAWVRSGGKGTTVKISATSMDILGVSNGTTVQIRKAEPQPITSARVN